MPAHFCASILFFVFSMVFGLPRSLFAQLPPPKLVMDIGGGANTYQGDLNKFGEKWDATAHVSVRFQQWKRWHPGVQVSYGQAIGEDFNFTTALPSVYPNQTFQNTFLAANLDLQFNLVKKDRFKLYLSQGIGFLKMELKGSKGEDLTLSPETRAENESYSTNTLIAPSGFGAAYSFKNGFGVGTTLMLYNTFTPYFDNISKTGNSPDTHDNLAEIRFYVQIPLSFEQKRI